MKLNKARTVEIIGISLLTIISYFIIIMDGNPIFIGPFNNIDNSITPARMVDILVSLGITFSVLYALAPRYLVKRDYKRFFMYSVLLVLLFSIIEFFCDQVILNRYAIPADPEMAYKLHGVTTGFKSYNFTRLPGNSLVYFVAVAYFRLKSWISEKRDSEKLEKEHLKSEVDFLRSQINPHFLFNALNNVYAITQRNQDVEAGKAITKLSSLLRFMLHEGNEELISLNQEVELISDLIAINELRFGPNDDVKIDFFVKGDTQNYKIAPLLLIPLVENAFKHGISALPAGQIRISLTVESGDLNFTVENTKFNATEPMTSFSGIGLQNLEKRLVLIYKTNCKLILEDKGTEYVASIMIKNVDMHSSR